MQAKLNMFAAYEDELKGREGGVGKLTELVGQAGHHPLGPHRATRLGAPTPRHLTHLLPHALRTPLH